MQILGLSTLSSGMADSFFVQLRFSEVIPQEIPPSPNYLPIPLGVPSGMDILAIGDQPVLSSRKCNDDLDIADSYHCMGAVLQLQGQSC